MLNTDLWVRSEVVHEIAAAIGLDDRFQHGRRNFHVSPHHRRVASRKDLIKIWVFRPRGCHARVVRCGGRLKVLAAPVLSVACVACVEGRLKLVFGFPAGLRLEVVFVALKLLGLRLTIACWRRR